MLVFSRRVIGDILVNFVSSLPNIYIYAGTNNRYLVDLFWSPALMYFTYLFMAVLGLHWCAGLPIVAASRGYSLIAGFSLEWFLLLPSAGSRACGLNSHSSWALEHRLNSCLAVPQYAGSSWTRGWTRVSCIGRWIICHWTIRKAPVLM